MLNKKNTSRVLNYTTLSGSILSTPSHVIAQTLVKSVDASGNVTYSDKTVTEASTVSEISIHSPIHLGPMILG